VALVCLALVSPAAAWADESTERAKRHNAEARKLFNLGLFKQAAAEYKNAYLARPVPALLFNLGQCHYRMPGDANGNKAVHYYEAYLQAEPASPLRGEIEKKIANIRRRKKRQQSAAASAPLYKKWWFWTVVGVAVTGATVATFVVLNQPPDPVAGNATPGVLRLP
jgi:hypothetical protein